ncbi:MAG: hypothetical protein EOM51_07530 [Clostridia bacterium]|nr:hypothetical protein [Clostridia bacterium]
MNCEIMLMENNVDIVYFSGTGGTERAAKCFKTSFEKVGREVTLSKVKDAPISFGEEDGLILLLYPVLAANAPRLVHDWIERLESVKGKRAAVISVSGGGEMSPNTACRAAVIRKLERKGFVVTYEEMLVMPANFIKFSGVPLSRLLLEALPKKVEAAVSRLESGFVTRSRPLPVDRLISAAAKLEQLGAVSFGKSIAVTDACISCGRCAENCPSGNITMLEGNPIFGSSCNLCMGCIYGCPTGALKPQMMKSAVLKEGFNLEAIEKAELPQNADINALTRGYSWKGVRKYLTGD